MYKDLIIIYLKTTMIESDFTVISYIFISKAKILWKFKHSQAYSVREATLIKRLSTNLIKC